MEIDAGFTADDIAKTIHPHPTLSETIALSAEMLNGTITDLLCKRINKKPLLFGRGQWCGGFTKF